MRMIVDPIFRKKKFDGEITRKMKSAWKVFQQAVEDSQPKASSLRGHASFNAPLIAEADIVTLWRRSSVSMIGPTLNIMYTSLLYTLMQREMTNNLKNEESKKIVDLMAAWN